MKICVALVMMVFAVLAANNDQIASGISVERLGWTLVHSLWQLTLIAVIAAVIDRCLKHRASNTRYTAATDLRRVSAPQHT